MNRFERLTRTALNVLAQSPQRVGDSFDVEVRILDANNNLMDDFEGAVTLGLVPGNGTAGAFSPRVLEDIGFPASESWWSRLKANWLQYLDENGRENANAPAAPCCNNPRGIAPTKKH